MLNRCPTCQASVLDDDAEVCPFCGSPMDPAKATSFKPKASAAANAPAPAKPKAEPTKPATKPVAAATSGESKKPAAKRPTDDDPFAADAAATASAIPLGRKPTPQRSHKVICPMCDTAGYAPTAASGKEVRCAKPDCMVPVFTAPDFAAPKEPEPEPASSLTPTLITFGAVFGILLLGVAVWWFGVRKPPERRAPTFASNETPPPQVDRTQTEQETPDQGPAEPPPPAPGETLAAVLGHLPAIAEDIAEPQRHPLRRRYAAEAYAIAGRIEAAQEQVEKLNASRSGDQFYKITPLAELVWTNLSRGNEQAARSAFEQSVGLTARIPRGGFDPARIVIGWSTAAARFGQQQSARDLARAPRDDAAGEQLLAMLHAASLFSEENLHAEHQVRPLRNWSQPKSTAVVFSLMRRGARNEAKSWADGSPGTSRAENLAAWAEAIAAASDTSGDQRAASVLDAVGSLNADERTYVLARAAVRAASRDETPVAERMLASAVESSAQLGTPQPFSAANMAELARQDLAEPGQALLAAAALGEAARAAALLGKNDQAVELISRSLDHAASTAPSNSIATERQKEVESLGISGVQSRLKTDLNLANDADANRAAVEYRRKVGQLQNAARARREFEAELLARAIDWKLGSQVLAEVGERENASASDGYLTGSTGGRLLGASILADDQTTAQAIRGAGGTNRDVPLLVGLELTLVPLINDGKWEAAAREIYGSRWSRLSASERLAMAIRTACRIAEEKSAADAFTFAAALSDGVAREESLRYLSAFAARAGDGAAIERLLLKTRLTSTERGAGLLGLTEGLVAIGAAARPPSPGET